MLLLYLFQKESLLFLSYCCIAEFNDKAGKTQIACDTNSRNCLLRSIMQRMLERNNASRRVYFCHLQMRLVPSLVMEIPIGHFLRIAFEQNRCSNEVPWET